MGINLKWEQHESYKLARERTDVIYLFEWNGEPFYWGVAAQFGKRYNVGYRHLIEGALQNGGKLYTAQIDENEGFALTEIENDLIVRYGHKMNSRINSSVDALALEHSGERPVCIMRDLSHKNNVDEEKGEEAKWYLCSTFAKGTKFALIFSREKIIIRRGSRFSIINEFRFEQLMVLLEGLQDRFGGDTFPLDNSVVDNDVEVGLGTMIANAFEENRQFGQVASQLSRLFCDAGFLERAGGVGHPHDPTRYRVLGLPESRVDLRDRMESVAIDIYSPISRPLPWDQ